MNPNNPIEDWLHRFYPRAEFRQTETGDPEVLHCGDPAAEYAALTRHAALVFSPRWMPILVEGKDAIPYLHRRLSQSVESLPLGSGAHALQLGGDGRLQSDLLVYRGAEALFVLAEHRFAPADADLIEKYVLTDDVTVSRPWVHEFPLGLAGPDAPEIIDSLADQVLDRAVLARDPWIALLSVTLGGLPCRIFGDGRWAVPYYHLSVPRMAVGQLLRTLDDVCRRSGGGVAGSLAAELLRIESGLPRLGIDTTPKTIPLEAGLEDAISFDKGCYSGQEVIARITNLGHPVRQLVRLSLEDERALPPGTTLGHDGREVGHVTSSATLPGLGRTEALGSLHWADRELGEIEVQTADGSVKARVSPLKTKKM